MDSRSRSDNWNSDLYIITHTNAPNGNYTLAMYDAHAPSSGQALAKLFAKTLDGPIPGGRLDGSDAAIHGDSLPELHAQAPLRAYIELFFHTNQTQVNWFQGGGGIGNGVKTASWRYGYVIDQYLGYP